MPQLQQQRERITDIISSNDDEASELDQIAKARGWWRPDDDSAYYPMIQGYLKDDIDRDTVISWLLERIDQEIVTRKLDNVCFMDLWYSIIHSAKRISLLQTGQKGEHNAYLLAKLTGLLTTCLHHQIKDHEEYNYSYSLLFEFGMACREVCNDTPDPYVSEIEINAWANVNCFFARVTEEGLLDLSLYAIWAMREALEDKHQNDLGGTAAKKYNVYVPAAAAWILVLGRTLYEKEEDLTPKDPRQGNPARGGDLWKGKPEFSKERWLFWKGRLAVISKLDEVSDKTRDISKAALQAMERAETFPDRPHGTISGS